MLKLYRKVVRSGFSFNLMVVGRSGLGKSTFINSLFLSEFYDSKKSDNIEKPAKTQNVCSQTVLLKVSCNLISRLSIGKWSAFAFDFS